MKTFHIHSDISIHHVHSSLFLSFLSQAQFPNRAWCHKCSPINADFAVNLSRRPIHIRCTIAESAGVGVSRFGRLLRLEVCVLACKYLIKAAVVAGGICARTRCVRASTPVGVATVNIWLCMSLAGAECTLTAAALARRRINSATCSVNYDILSERNGNKLGPKRRLLRDAGKGRVDWRRDR